MLAGARFVIGYRNKTFIIPFEGNSIVGNGIVWIDLCGSLKEVLIGFRACWNSLIWTLLLLLRRFVCLERVEIDHSLDLQLDQYCLQCWHESLTGADRFELHLLRRRWCSDGRKQRDDFCRRSCARNGRNVVSNQSQVVRVQTVVLRALLESQLGPISYG